jgi:sodium transport system ATP-binding protein
MSIVVDNLVKMYFRSGSGEFAAVDGISFGCQAGEVFGLLGPNGAGKTTTLRSLSTMLKPTSGSIRVMGIDAVACPQKVREKIGFYSADTSVYARFSPRELLRYFGTLSKYSGNLDERIETVISDLDMSSFADVRCEKLSTGMRQRASLGRGIIHDPPVLILDEPTSSLDVGTTLAIHKYIERWRNESKCVILSTHIMSEAEKLCNRIAILHKGRILANGTLEELRALTGEHYLEDVFLKLVEGSEIVAV